jgi:hypothetical protein
MKLTLEPTATIQNVDGVPCRIWEGVSDAGNRAVPVKAWVRMVQPQTHDEAALAAFGAELQALPEPSKTLVVTDLRFIL